MPVLGLGTYTLTGDTAVRAVKNALKLGYRHIDAAQAYRNEAEIYEGIRQSGLKREEVFVTSKVSPKNMYTGRVRESLEESVANLGGYIDLMLIHFPVRGEGVVEETWKVMEEFVDAGKIKAIGISSFKQAHIDSLMRYARIKPAVNQIEIHPYYNELDLTAYNESEGIVVEGWSPFGSGVNGVLSDPVIARIAGKYGKSPAQVILRWNVQRGRNRHPPFHRAGRDGREYAHLRFRAVAGGHGGYQQPEPERDVEPAERPGRHAVGTDG